MEQNFITIKRTRRSVVKAQREAKAYRPVEKKADHRLALKNLYMRQDGAVVGIR